MILQTAKAYRVHNDDVSEEGWVILSFEGYLGNGRPVYNAEVFVFGLPAKCYYYSEGKGPQGPTGAKDCERIRKDVAELAFHVAVEDIRNPSDRSQATYLGPRRATD